ncbi:MAG: TolC family protein [Bdellovibrionia bacterium]
MPIRSFILIITWIWAFGATGAELDKESITLQAALFKAYSANPAIAASQALADAEHAAIQSESFLEDPKVGLMRENNMSFMQMQQGPMDSISVSQQFKFPVKYILSNKSQSAKANQAEEMAKQKRLEVRTKVVSAYYSLYSVDRVLALLNAQRESLREIARIAETRYSTGGVPQQDEMKAHVEQTLLEKDTLMVQEELSTIQAALSAAMGDNSRKEIALPKEELKIPEVTIELAEIPKQIELHSREIKVAQFAVVESETQKSLSYLGYAPDFSLNYRRMLGSFGFQNAYSASIEFTIPLWFFAKQSNEVSSASSRAIEAQKKLESIKNDKTAEAKSLTAKVRSFKRVLEVYQTGLIPQAASTLNSSRASYRAGRSGFIELLDSERSLYNVRIAYYRILSQFTESLSKLEEIMGRSLSTLPFGEIE